MTLPTSLPTSYRFGSFELFVVQRRLFAEGREVRLGSRALDLLLALIERAGAVISREHLLDAVWSGVMVEENNIAVQVTALRKVLGRHAIATVPGRGYRFSMLPVDAAPQEREIVDTIKVRPTEVSFAYRPAAALPAAVLPALGAPLLGRAKDLDELANELRQRRLVNVVGPAGIGKTSVALAAAHAQRMLMRNGVAWVELSAAEAPEQVLPAIGRALGLVFAPEDDALPALVTHLRGLHVLLVLDNAEHLVAEVARVVHQLLSATDEVRILVTSQAALKVSGERLFRLAALSVPEPECTVEEALQHGAVALFVDQVQALDRRFTLTDRNVGRIVALCRELDGIALAIKLAAFRLPMFGVNELSARLSNRFKLLRDDALGAPPRQQTLRAAMDWSHSLLSPNESKVFRRLGVFAGGFTLELACAVAQDAEISVAAVEEALVKMVDCSLVQPVDDGDASRYRLLATTRDYALLQLVEAGEEPSMRRRHAHVLTQSLAHPSRSGDAQARKAWLARGTAEIDNLRAALDWCVWYDGDAAVALLAEAAEIFGALHLFQEMQDLYRNCESLLHPGLPASLLARHGLGHCQILFGVNPRAAAEIALKAIAFYRVAGDPQRLYLALGQVIPLVAFMSIPDARSMLDEQARLEQAQASPRTHLRRLRHMAEAFVLVQEGRLAQAREAAKVALPSWHSSVVPLWLLPDLRDDEPECEELHDLELALSQSEELDAGVSALHRLHVQGHVLAALLETDCLPESRKLAAAMLKTARGLAWDGSGLWPDLCAWLAAKEHRHADAARLLGYAERMGGPPDARLPGLVLVRQHVMATVWSGLDAALAADLIDEGANLGQEAACRLALASPQYEPRPSRAPA